MLKIRTVNIPIHEDYLDEEKLHEDSLITLGEHLVIRWREDNLIKEEEGLVVKVEDRKYCIICLNNANRYADPIEIANTSEMRLGQLFYSTSGDSPFTIYSVWRK